MPAGPPPLAVALDATVLMHPTVADTVPAGAGWVYEIKWDGVRVLALRRAGAVRLLARSGIDVTARYPETTRAFAALPGGDFAFDGELVVLDDEGRPRFDWLAERMHRTRAPAAARAVVCYVFDCLALDGLDVRHLPLVARKALCRERVAAPGALRYCDHVEDGGAAFLEAARAAGLEGVVAKRAAAAYERGRSRDWVKVKCCREGVFAIGGWTDPAGTRAHLGALHVGEWQGRRLAYVGKVGSGLDERTLAALAEPLAALALADCPFALGDPPRGRTHHWVAPRLACRVRYGDRTRDGRLRHPVFLGLAAPAIIPRARSAMPRRPARRR